MSTQNGTWFCTMCIYVFLIDINKLVPRYQIMNTLKIWISRNSGRKYHHVKLKLSDINRKMTEISYVWNSQKVIHTHINPWFVYPLSDILSTEIKINVDTSTSEHTALHGVNNLTPNVSWDDKSMKVSPGRYSCQTCHQASRLHSTLKETQGVEKEVK